MDDHDIDDTEANFNAISKIYEQVEKEIEVAPVKNEPKPKAAKPATKKDEKK